MNVSVMSPLHSSLLGLDKLLQSLLVSSESENNRIYKVKVNISLLLLKTKRNESVERVDTFWSAHAAKECEYDIGLF